MKKLNRKGFTLVELLAVIIILAIVVGITIPAVLTTTNNAKKKAFSTAAQTAADWVDRQYTVFSTGLYVGGDNSVATLDSNFVSACVENGALKSVCETGNTAITDAGFIAAVGVSTNNVSGIKVKINTSTGRSCVTLISKANGDYITPDKAAGTEQTGGIC